MPDDRRHLLERFQLVDVARKVVGVGSVGTRAFIALLQGRDEQDPLFLQVKEATASVLEDHLPKSRYQPTTANASSGPADDAGRERHLPGLDEGRDTSRHFYWRQLRDMKGSALVEAMSPLGARLLRAALRLDAGPGTRPLRRPGRDRMRTSGTSDDFDRAITDFAKRYADQNERDYQAFVGAVESGRLQATHGM